jgi:hypothetical protein
MVEINIKKKKGKLKRKIEKYLYRRQLALPPLETLFFSLLTVRHKVRSNMSASVGSHGRL